jgi:hypothetical protein
MPFINKKKSKMIRKKRMANKDKKKNIKHGKMLLRRPI